MHKQIAVLMIVIGFVLMVMKIYADSEPGAIPLLLVILGIAWYCIAQLRMRSQQK